MLYNCTVIHEYFTPLIFLNKNLEQQAQVIFKEWFIDNPENNEWSTGTFSELIKSTLNGDWGKEAPTGNNTEKVYCIRGADIPEVKAGNKGQMPTRYIIPKNFATKQLTAGDIVVEISGGSPTQSTGRCTAITQSLLDRYDSGMVCTNFCKAMKPKEGYSLFIYYYWQYLYGKGVFFSYENGTTGIKNLDFSGFIETETILIPPVNKVIAFDDYCKSIFNQIFANGKQNGYLAVLRDTLVPKLMYGELDVSDIDI
nr:restriction endonuclease subunit S [Clostridium sp. Marseille-P7770]